MILESAKVILVIIILWAGMWFTLYLIIDAPLTRIERFLRTKKKINEEK